MNIILKQDVEKLGFKNEIVSVKNGYGRNYLIPKGYGILATETAVKVLTENLKQQTKKEETEIAEANKIAEALVIALITRALNEDKSKMFTNADKFDLMNNVDPDVVTRIATHILNSEPEAEEIAGN